MIWDKISWQILDIVISWYGMCCFSGWKGFITVKWCVFVNFPDCSCCSFVYLYPLIHIADDYLSKNVIGFVFCEITNSHSYNTVVVLRYLFKNIVIFTYFITLAAPTPWNTQKLSVTTYMINNCWYEPTWNFAIVVGFSAPSPRPKSEWL